MSEDGGFEEVEESLRAAASCACTWARVIWSWAMVAVSASTCACSRWQLAQGVVASAPMLPYSTTSRINGTAP